MKLHLTLCLTCAVGAFWPTTTRADDHHHDVVVGRTSANQLAVEYDFAEMVQLPPVSGLFNGWAGDDPGFGHLEADEPAEDFYTLGAGAGIYFEVVAFDAALIGNPLTDALDVPGEQTLLGDDSLHEHIDWLIDSDHAGFDPLQTVWNAQFRLVDLGGLYTPSDVYTLRFTNVPEPATAALLALGAIALVRRR